MHASARGSRVQTQSCAHQLYFTPENQNYQPHPHGRPPYMKYVEGCVRPIYMYRPRTVVIPGLIVGVGREIMVINTGLCNKKNSSGEEDVEKSAFKAPNHELESTFYFRTAGQRLA